MLIAAFDPGSASGAFAVVDSTAGVLAIDDFPIHQTQHGRAAKVQSELDLHTLHARLAEHWPFTHAFIEKVSARPKQGLASTFRFGVAYGALTGMLVTMGVPLTFVLPQAWQKHHGVGPAPDAARQRAAQLFPEIAPKLARRRDEHRADALLIAAFGMSRLTATAERALSQVDNLTA